MLTRAARLLLQQVLRAPQDRGARLVYADALQSAGNPRGDYIVAQLQLAEPLAPWRRSALEREVERMFERHAARFTAPFRRLASGCRFRGGFVDRLSVSFPRLLEDDAFRRLMRHEPVQQLRLWDVDARLMRLLELPEMERVTHLSCRGVLPSESLKDVASSERLRNITTLDLANMDLGQDVSALATSQVLRPKRLTLNATNIADGEVRALLSSPLLESCDALFMARNPISGEAADHLQHPFAGGRLEH